MSKVGPKGKEEIKKEFLYIVKASSLGLLFLNHFNGYQFYSQFILKCNSVLPILEK
jgi:hypothetical protein